MASHPPEPADPHEEGVPEPRPDDARVEGAHVLASEARAELEPRGFDEQQILKWAEAFIEEQGSGDVDAFVAWIARQQGARDSGNVPPG